ncbi:MAG TPA: bifunctional 4-hydroxy-2-oxoglutarate aldolase/2-dehydro-3-deoxy-phosphogluconate aldolase [Micrococcaceae bacterium]|nr:bifunctional 4-hydroxy-2-oxoglutarate aldolase/2-dehydro-3-deoxy-phosphogluconate aldolase [Micrococcaceae bacterium]
MNPQEFLTGLRNAKLLAIVRSQDPEAAVRAAVTVLEEGFGHIEISLNTAEALRVIEAVRSQAPEGSLVGAGTVLSSDDVSRVVEAGAQFIVTPALGPSVAESVRRGLPVVAGAMTPTEVYTATQLGATAVKLFPASLGGAAYLTAIREPFPDVPLVAVGGVDHAAAQDYLARGAVAVGLGSPLFKDAAAGGSLTELRERARHYVRLAGGEL